MIYFHCKGRSSMQIQCFAAKCFSSLSSLAPLALPSRRETHLWYIVPNEVKDVALLTQYHDLLSPCELEDIFSMPNEVLQKRALLARALVRSTLSRYTNSRVNPRSLMFRKNTFGKPEVEWKNDKNWDPPPLHFNLSHTSSLIACGVTVDAPIGIDVEEKERKTKHSVSSFVRRYFSPHEVEHLHNIQDPEIQRQEFIKLWTLKEAYVKALGRGFSAAPFKNFAIRFRGAGKCGLLEPGISISKLQKIFSYVDRGVGHSSHDTHSDVRGPDWKSGSYIPVDSTTLASEIVVEAFDDSEHLTTNWKFALLELTNFHYASICMENKSREGEESNTMKLKVWKTIPFVQDECISGTDSVLILSM